MERFCFVRSVFVYKERFCLYGAILLCQECFCLSGVSNFIYMKSASSIFNICCGRQHQNICLYQIFCILASERGSDNIIPHYKSTQQIYQTGIVTMIL
jgi:hypothetical protein